MAEVFRLHCATNLEREVFVHLEQHVRQVNVLAAISPLVADKAEHERNDLATVVRAPASEVGVYNNSGEGSSAECDAPFLVPEELLVSQIAFEAIVETSILTVPVDVVSEVLGAKEVVNGVRYEVTCDVVLTEHITADTSKEDAVSALAHFYQEI